MMRTEARKAPGTAHLVYTLISMNRSVAYTYVNHWPHITHQFGSSFFQLLPNGGKTVRVSVYVLAMLPSCMPLKRQSVLSAAHLSYPYTNPRQWQGRLTPAP